MHSRFVRRDVDEQVVKLASERAGAFTRAEVYACGGSEPVVRRRMAVGSWIAAGGDVLVLAGWPDTVEQRRWIGLLAGGTAAHLSHEAAADVRDIRGVRRGLSVVTVAHPLHLRIENVTFHQLGDVRPEHLEVVGGWPVTTPARTIVDLAAVVSRGRLRTAVQHVVVEGQASFGQIGQVLRDVRRRGKPGIRRAVSVLDELSGEPPPASQLEQHLHDVARLARIPIVRQHVLPWAREPIDGVVDAAVLESRLILEADGRSWHAWLEQMARDRRRDREAAEAGWLTLRWVYDDLVHDARDAARSLLEVHRVRTRGSDRRLPSV
jgi:very-short-patch-repair endonuclease